MFRRTKTKLYPPEPPTFAQILEDLNKFDVEKSASEEVRTLEIPANPLQATTTTDRDAAIARWWGAFETFQTDVQNMQRMRRNLLLAKADLIETNEEVAKHVTESKRRIADALDSVKIE